ncbi:MAG: hypothetical protein DRJ03_19395 [Chloroflexi bacterium]|nr:MAG: hypothetical protein DRJ03_19395 [Chloroflexota bacterium]
MKVSFDPFKVVSGGLQVVHRVRENINQAEQDGKVEKKEIGNIILSALLDFLTVLAAAAMIDEKPVFPTSSDSDHQ